MSASHLNLTLSKLLHHQLLDTNFLRQPRRSGRPLETWDRALSIQESQMLSVCMNMVLHTFLFLPLMLKKYSLLQFFAPLDPWTANFLLGVDTLTAFEMNLHCFSWLLSDQKWSKIICLSPAVSLGCWHRLQFEWQGFLRQRALRIRPDMDRCSFPEFKAILAAWIFRRDGYSNLLSCWFSKALLGEEEHGRAPTPQAEDSSPQTASKLGWSCEAASLTTVSLSSARQIPVHRVDLAKSEASKTSSHQCGEQMLSHRLTFLHVFRVGDDFVEKSSEAALSLRGTVWGIVVASNFRKAAACYQQKCDESLNQYLSWLRFQSCRLILVGAAAIPTT